MPGVSFLVLEGLERGTVFENLPAPVSIGREEDNTIRLNDERVSRFHAKVQQDGGHFILTDLLSTNGTRVNGHCIQMRVLQDGDLVSIGRCLLVYGIREKLNQQSERADTLENAGSEEMTKMLARSEWNAEASAEPDSADWKLPELFGSPPPAPVGLRPLHQAQFSDVLAYVHDRLRIILQAAREQPGNSREFTLQAEDWNRLLNLEMDLAVYLRRIADPQDEV